MIGSYFDVRYEGRDLITRWDVVIKTEPFNGWTVPSGFVPCYTQRQADTALNAARQDWMSARLFPGARLKARARCAEFLNAREAAR